MILTSRFSLVGIGVRSAPAQSAARTGASVMCGQVVSCHTAGAVIDAAGNTMLPVIYLFQL